MLEEFQSLYIEGVIPRGGEGGDTSIESNLFLSGNLAMSIVTDEHLYDMLALNENPEWIEGYEPIDIGIVTAPVHVHNAGIRPLTDLAPVFAISANAENAQEAWEYIEHVATFNWEYNTLSTTNLPTHETWFDRKNSSFPVDLAPFIPQKVGSNSDIDFEEDAVLYSSLDIFYQALSGQMSIPEALKQIEIAGNEALQGL
mgnify:CR=1 FL=1